MIRIEAAAFLNGHAQQLQGVTHRGNDVLRHGCGDHALGGPDKQRIIEGLAQTGEGVAHCRLCDAYNLTGAGQIGFGINGIKYNEQVQVDFTEVHRNIVLR